MPAQSSCLRSIACSRHGLAAIEQDAPGAGPLDSDALQVRRGDCIGLGLRLHDNKIPCLIHALCTHKRQAYDLPLEDWSQSALSICVVGASGDLAKKKIFPALFALYYDNHLPKVRHADGGGAMNRLLG